MNKKALIRVKALMIKESRQILRDPSSILIAFVLPTILLVLFGYGINLDSKNIRLGVAVETSHPQAARLAQAFRATPYFAVQTAADRRELVDKVTAGELRGLVVIPQTGQSPTESEAGAQVLVITDGSEVNTANYVRNYAAGVVSGEIQQQALENGIQNQGRINIEQRFRYNPELRSRNALLPGSLAIIMSIVGTLLTSLVIAREWERGTMEALLATPTTPVEMLLGKIVPYFILGFLSLFIAVFVSITLFQVPYRGSFLSLMLSGGAFLICALGMGLLISTATKNQFVASQVALLVAYLPAFMLSGFIFEISAMPWPVRQVTRIIPARYLVTSLQTQFLVGDIWAVILPNVLYLMLMAGIFFTITLIKSPARLEAN